MTDGVNKVQKTFHILVRKGILPKKMYFVQNNKILSALPSGNICATVKTSELNANHVLYLAVYKNDKLLGVQKVSENTVDGDYAVYTLPCEDIDSDATNVKAFLLDKETLQPIVVSVCLSLR